MTEPSNPASDWQAARPALVLASASAIRLTLLRDAGLAVAAEPAAVDEAAIKAASRSAGLTAEATAQRLAEAKARAVADRGDPDRLVIGADQMLVCEGRWFDKPTDRVAARAQLLALRGRAHALPTALCCWRGGRAIWRHVSRPRLVMRAFSEAFLDRYLAREGERVLESVGAYRLEGPGVQLFEAIEGEHAAILGLPLLPLLAALRQADVIGR